MERHLLNQKVFLSLLAIITLVFVWLLLPFSGAIFWAFAFAILFSPLYNRILGAMPQKMPAKSSVAAVLTVLVCLFIVILPLIALILMLIKEGQLFYTLILVRQVSFSDTMVSVFNDLPLWMINVLHHFGITDIDDLQQKLLHALVQTAQFVGGQIFYLGQNIFGFGIAFAVMLYLLFFFLRDGEKIANTTRRAIPLSMHKKVELVARFTGAVRATIKGNLVISIIQGTLGGIIFFVLGIHAPVLWGAVMALLSMFPGGTGIVWLPAAIYLIATGSVVKGLVLIVFGLVVIGLAENALRPFLVGKNTQMPDYIVAMSTLGGLSLLGLNGFVIGPVIAALFLSSWRMFTDEIVDAPQPFAGVTALRDTEAAAPDGKPTDDG